MTVIVTLALCLFLHAPVWAVEDLVFSAPITKTSQTKARIDSIYMSPGAARVDVVFVEPITGELIPCSESGTAALNLMSTLNTANLSSNSLDKRAVTWAQGKGCLPAGTVSGTPR